MYRIDLTKLMSEDVLVYDLGIFKGVVYPPDPYVCLNSSKLFSRFFYVTEGSIVFNENKPNMLVAKEGDIVYLPYDVTYVSRWHTSQNGGFIAVNFIAGTPPVSFSENIGIVLNDSGKSYLTLFENLYNTWNGGSYGYKIKSMSLFYDILYNISLDCSSGMLKLKHHSIYKGIMYLENNYLSDVTIKELAQMCSVSVGTFRRLFKEYNRMPPITYRNYLRVKKAKEFLKSGEHNVSTAAEAVNCHDISYFNKLFNKYFNANPSDFFPTPEKANTSFGH